MKFMNVIKTFKTKEDMVSYRNSMIDKAEELLGAGNMEEYEAQIADINTFDKEYEQYAEAQANMAALRGNVSLRDVLSAQGRQNVIEGISANVTEQDERGYRMAFMNFVLKGIAIPTEFRNEDAYTTTSDTVAVIPNHILDRIVEKMEVTGKILNKVTRTFYRGGVTVPTSSVKPVATWTTERGTTDKQNKPVGSITFAYHKLKCVVAVSLTADTVTLEVFERTIANNIAEAMVKAMESSIISGSGVGQPKGVTKETVVTGQEIEIGAAVDITYQDVVAAEGALPEAYEGAEWYMTKKTYFNQIVGMVDENGQPICRTSVGLDGKPSYRILGRPVNFVSPEDMAVYTKTVSTDTIVAFMYRMEDYMLNTNMDVTVKHYEDNDTDDKMTKAIMLVDGKSIDNNSLVALKKKATG